MSKDLAIPNDQQWQAISDNNLKTNGNFWYGVTTTKIFCKLSCPSRLPRRNNVVVFNHPSEALEAGFRPCKRCRPLEQTVSNQVWVDEIEYVIQTHYMQKLSLNELASIVHGDPSRHTYKKITGRTPQQRLTEIRLENASHLLKTSSDSISQIGIKVGIQNTAYFISLFKNKYGKTPKQYQFVHK